MRNDTHSIPHMHPIFGDILTAHFPRKDDTIMRDQADKPTPSLQGQQVAPRAALGTNLCYACHQQSPVYRLWPSCRSCSEEFCPSCQQPGSYEQDEGRESCLCPTCAADDAVPLPDSVLLDQVATVLARCVGAASGDAPVQFDELPPAERQRYRDAARVAWSLLDQEAIQIAQWVAADRLIWERTNGNRGWTHASGKERRLAWGDARVAITSARQYWMGMLCSEFASDARRALQAMREGTVAPFVTPFLNGGQQ